MQGVVGIVNRPAIDALVLRDSIHDDSNEVSPGMEVRQQLAGEGRSVEAGTRKALAAHPGVDDSGAVSGAIRMPEVWD
jgi:hypothetical protein